MANVWSFPKVSAGGVAVRDTGRGLTGAKNIVANRETLKIRKIYEFMKSSLDRRALQRARGRSETMN